MSEKDKQTATNIAIILDKATEIRDKVIYAADILFEEKKRQRE